MSSSSQPRRGVGSNQYQSRPGAPGVGSRRDTAQVTAAVTDEDIDPELVAIMFELVDLDGWRDWGASNEEIVTWHRSGRSSAEAAVLLSVGITDPETADRVCGPGRIGLVHLHRWADTGVPWADVMDWNQTLRAHLPFWVGEPHENAGVWHAAGFTPGECAMHMRSGFTSPADLLWWSDRCSPGDDHVALMRREFTAHGFNPDSDDSWENPWIARRGGVHDPAVLAQWRDAAYQDINTAENEEPWLWPLDIPPLHHAGVPTDYAIAFAQATFRQRLSPNARAWAATWAAGQRDVTTAFDSILSEGADLDMPLEWVGRGFTLDEAKRYEVKRARVAAWWRDHGYTENRDIACGEALTHHGNAESALRRVGLMLLNRGLTHRSDHINRALRLSEDLSERLSG